MWLCVASEERRQGVENWHSRKIISLGNLNDNDDVIVDDRGEAEKWLWFQRCFEADRKRTKDEDASSGHQSREWNVFLVYKLIFIQWTADNHFNDTASPPHLRHIAQSYRGKVFLHIIAALEEFFGLHIQNT